MKRVKKSNRVSWPPIVELCQIRLFLPEDCPSKVGVDAQDQLQTKTSWTLDSNYVDPDIHPSRFEGSHYTNPLKDKLSHIPQIKWKCPPKFVLNYNWRVVAAEESEEAEAQKQREMRVIEAVYPHRSAIPPSPSASLDVEECDHDDSHIPLIPVIPVEEEDDAADMQSDIAKPPNTSLNSQRLALHQGMFISGNPNAPECDTSSLKPSANEKPALETVSGLQADVAVAAAAALIAITKSKEQGSLIDTDLLIKILSNPKMMEKMINEQKALADNESASVSSSKPVIPSILFPDSKPSVARESINDHGRLISGLNSLTQLVLPGSEADLVTFKRVINEHGAPDSARSVPLAPVVSLPSPKPDIAMFPPNLQPLPNVMMQPGLTMEPLSPDAVSVSSSSAMTIERMINEYGAPDSARSEPMSKSIPLTPVVSLPSPKRDISVLPPNLQPVPDVVSVSSSTAMSIKRMINEYGSLDFTGNEPKAELMSSMSSSTPMVSLSSPIPNFGVLPMKNLHPVPDVVQTCLAKEMLSARTVPRFSTMTAPLVKDVNYYKNLVKQHGEKQETQFGKQHSHVQDHKQAQYFKPIGTKTKNQKPCIFFNSSKGCRNGSKCPYKHDMSNKSWPGSLMEAPIAKKMKLGREITGNT